MVLSSEEIDLKFVTIDTEDKIKEPEVVVKPIDQKKKEVI